MINLALIVSYGLAVGQNCRGCCGIICHIIGCAIFHVDSCCALEASSVQSMVCSRTGYNIKSAFITFFATVSFIRTSVASCRLNSFCCPILSPGKTCIYIFICCFFLLISKGKRLVTCCSYFDFKFISAKAAAVRSSVPSSLIRIIFRFPVAAYSFPFTFTEVMFLI